MRTFLLEEFALEIGAGDVRHAGFVPVDGLHLAVEINGAALLHDLVGGGLPYLAGTEAGIEEISDQRLGRGRGLLTLERGEDRVPQRKALDALRGPIGADLIARNAPHFFGVGLEENLEQALAESIGHPLRERGLRLDRLQPRLEIAEENVEGLHRPEVQECVYGLERVIKIFALIDSMRQRSFGI